MCNDVAQVIIQIFYFLLSFYTFFFSNFIQKGTRDFILDLETFLKLNFNFSWLALQKTSLKGILLFWDAVKKTRGCLVCSKGFRMVFSQYQLFFDISTVGFSPQLAKVLKFRGLKGRKMLKWLFYSTEITLMIFLKLYSKWSNSAHNLEHSVLIFLGRRTL